MEFSEQLYIGPSIRHRKERILNRMEQGKMVVSLYCIARAANQIDLYDIYSYHELRQDYYKKHPVKIVGLAGSREEAIGIAAYMIRKTI